MEETNQLMATVLQLWRTTRRMLTVLLVLVLVLMLVLVLVPLVLVLLVRLVCL